MFQPDIPSNLQPLVEADGITLSNSIGALFVCFTLSTFLFGLLTFQVHHYYVNHPDARFAVKALAALVWFFDFGQSAFQMHGLFNMLITNFGNIATALNPIWTVNSSLIWAALVYATVQGFLTYRIKVLSRSYTIPIICWCAAVVRFGLTVAAAIVSLTMPLIDFEKKHINLIHGGVITGVILDNLVAISLSYYLFDRSRNALESTQSTVQRLIVFSIETGIVTSIVGIAVAVTCWTMPYNGIWFGILFFHSKIYANSLLLSLNREIPQENLTAQPVSVHPANLKPHQPYAAPSHRFSNHHGDVVVTLKRGSDAHSLESGSEKGDDQSLGKPVQGMRTSGAGEDPTDIISPK